MFIYRLWRFNRLFLFLYGIFLKMNNVIMTIIAIGAVIGGIDKILGNRYRLGEKFDEGFNMMGPDRKSVV